MNLESLINVSNMLIGMGVGGALFIYQRGKKDANLESEIKRTVDAVSELQEVIKDMQIDNRNFMLEIMERFVTKDDFDRYQKNAAMYCTEKQMVLSKQMRGAVAHIDAVTARIHQRMDEAEWIKGGK